MGFFRKAFSRAPGAKPSFVPPAFPFAGRVRLVHQDYDRIATGWWDISLGSAEEWQAKLREMEEGVRRHFGLFQMEDGQVVPRWNETTWARVRGRLVVEKG
ncbi:MAG: hypothetical protein A3K68_01995 [Euryarchaeota archaeon RBG_16_68_13]|nr:MAG: hypothetical protein A3K68_01995 [Euryarchaeota archaeon RBG_16_68_13]